MPVDPPPLDFDAFQRAVRALPWARLSKEVTRYARARCRRPEMGDDLAQEAIRRLIDFKTTPWNPVSEPEPSMRLMSIVNSLLWNDRTSARVNRTVGMTAKGRSGDEANRAVTVSRDFPDDRAASEETHVAGDLYHRRLALLRARLAEKPFVLGVLRRMLDGDETPAALCAATGKSLEEVIAARRMIDRYAAQVARDLDDEDADRDDRDLHRTREDRGSQSEVA